MSSSLGLTAPVFSMPRAACRDEEGESRDAEDLEPDRGCPGALERASPSLLPALVGRRAERRRAGALLGAVPARRRGHRRRQRGRRARRARAAELRRHADEEREHVALWDGFVEAAGGDVDDPPTPETDECVRAWSARSGDCRQPGDPLRDRERPARDLADQARGPGERYGFADGEATAYFQAPRAPRHRARRRGPRAALRARGDADEDRLVAAAEAAFRANWRLLDGV